MPASGGSTSDTNVSTNKVVDGQSHHLAYITPNEADQLVALGGKETMTEEGIPAYPPSENYGGSWGSSTESNFSESDDLESDFSDVTSSSPDTYSAPSSDSYSGMDNEQQAAHDQQHHQSWIEETQYPQYDGTEDLEEQREVDRQFAIDKGLITIDPNTGEQSPGPNVRNPEGVIVDKNDPSVDRDLTWKQHWDNRPAAIKWSPTLSFLYASGKNLGEWFSKNKGKSTYTPGEGGGDESQMMHDVAPHAPYIVSGTTKPTNSPAANWFSSSLGNTSLSGSNFSMATEYAAAKAKQKSILGSPSPVGQLAVNNSPFYNWLKDKNLDKGIL